MSCTKCELHKISKCNCLSGRGNLKADLFFICDAPAAEEESSKTPLSGYSGILLDEILKKHNLSRKDVFISYVCRCRPTSSLQDRQNRPLKSQEIKACREYLEKEIREVSPKIIIPLGGVASGVILGKKQILEIRGHVFESEEFNCKVIPTIHPFSCFKHQEHKKFLMLDIQRAVNCLTNTQTVPKTNYLVIDTEDMLDEIVKRMKDVKEFSLDLETEGFNWQSDRIIGVSMSWKSATGIYIPILQQMVVDEKQIITPTFKHDVFPKLKSLFENPEKKIIYANAKFDAKFLRAVNINPQIYFDVISAHHLIDENSAHDLKTLAWLYTDMGGYEQELTGFFEGLPKKDRSYLSIPVEILAKYGAADADATFRVYQVLREELKKCGVEYVMYNIIMPMTKVLLDMEYRGVLLDDQLLGQLKNKYEGQLMLIRDEVQKEVGDVNLNSNKQLQHLFFDILKLTPTTRTKTGYSVDKKALEILAKQHPIPSKIVEYRKISKLLSTYIVGMSADMDKDCRIHTRYNLAVKDDEDQSGAAPVTGRLSSSSPNLQNIPKNSDIKNLFKTFDNWSLIEADMSQMELRVMAGVSKDKILTQAFQNNEDMHTRTASELLGIPFGQVTKDQRTVGKCLNFGLNYGMQAQGLAETLKCSESQAAQYLKAFFTKFSGVARYMVSIKNQVKIQKMVSNIFGRKRRFFNINFSRFAQANDVERQAINFPIQSSASDIMSLATVRIHEKLRGFKAHIVLTVHDSVVVEVENSQVVEVYKIMKEELEKGVEIFPDIPFKADFKIGKRWGDIREVKLGENQTIEEWMKENKELFT